MLTSIFKTLTYFDLASYPLTREELFVYLWQPPRMRYEDFLLSLRGIVAPAAIPLPLFTEKFGYYFLSGREEVVENRRKKMLISEIKMKAARRAAKKLRAIPFLRAVFVCNSVGAGQATDDSDIDFFIVTAPGRTWIVRFFTNLILRLWGLRTYGNKIKNRICLSFFVDTDHLNLFYLRIAEDDVHFIYWLHQMVPIYDPDSLYDKFLYANSWTENFLPNIKKFSQGGYIRELADSRMGKIWKKSWEKMWQGAYGNLLESQAKQLQMTKMKFSVKEKAKQKDNGVVLGDGVIKLHENDRRSEYRCDWLESSRKN